MLKGKKILLGISGSIAAYKSVFILRQLIKAGAEVKVVMTPSAKQFVTPLTLSTLSKNEVISELSENDSWSNHVMLGRWADMMIVAPLSCNTLSKMASGLCDNLLMAVYLSATCPVVVAPAMDEDMWNHFTTKENIKKIKANGNLVLPVGEGELASGLTGAGRMAEPEFIIEWVESYFSKAKSFTGKNVLVTAGPTQEAIDPVRYISNHSSGKMGIAIAEEFYRRGANVILVCGPTNESLPSQIQIIKVTSALQMYDACIKEFGESDIAVMCAAVSDYTVTNISDKKIKKENESIFLELEKTKDILFALGSTKKKHQFLVGFALETNDEKQNAIKKLHGKNADIIVLNSLNDAGAGFGHSTNKVTIFDKKGGEHFFEIKSKSSVASDILNVIHDLYNV
ncbi:MAG: bifunctional phosphopantothenoylcysteine decarboxylase/phosphopantothenate--cysteine ligase CoaBC [Ferruginibacter sp.]|nr:bifunctional phosphopantothenoylcysteine decarboxylase/phosphopantothenate--cysteine ligase CoaBC [Ferruginibacter sp.]